METPEVRRHFIRLTEEAEAAVAQLVRWAVEDGWVTIDDPNVVSLTISAALLAVHDALAEKRNQ